jgi:hypothetical protein
MKIEFHFEHNTVPFGISKSEVCKGIFIVFLGWVLHIHI